MKEATPLPTVRTDNSEALETSSFNAFPASRPSMNPSSNLAENATPSRPSSSLGVRIRPSTPQSNAGGFASPLSPRKSSFVGTVHDPESFDPPFSPLAKGSLLWNKLSSFIVSSTFLILVVFWASAIRIAAIIPKLLKRSPPHIYSWEDNAKHWKQEKVVKDIAYYAQHCGYDIKDEEVETQDGYFLR
jgi:hypothetical protein